MAVERKRKMILKKRLQNNLLNFMWLVIGAITIGGVYLLSYHGVDDVVVSESKNFFEFVRAVLR